VEKDRDASNSAIPAIISTKSIRGIVIAKEAPILMNIHAPIPIKICQNFPQYVVLYFSTSSSNSLTFDETGEHCKSNASRRAHDRRALTGEAGNASRRKVIVEATARSLEWASAWRTQDESGPTFSRVIRTNFGDRMAKIFRENSDSLVLLGNLLRFLLL
jgi:hypothetical protein